MAALVRRAALDALVSPRFLAELPEELRDHVRFLVAQAGPGEHAQITLSYAAGPVREAARRLQAQPRVPKKLAETLPELARLPGY